jgi:hypothetical protein
MTAMDMYGLETGKIAWLSSGNEGIALACYIEAPTQHYLRWLENKVERASKPVELSTTAPNNARDETVRCTDCVHCVGKDDTCLSCGDFSQWSPRTASPVA